MATRAEQFRYDAERAGPKRTAQPRRAKRPRAGETRVESGHAARKASYQLEDSAGRPSRKSSRKAANRQKTDVQFRLKRQVAETRPHAPGASP